MKIGWIGVTLVGFVGTAMGEDLVRMPDLTREVCDPSGTPCAVIVRPEQLRPGVFPELTIRDGDQVAAVTLSYPIGPRFVLISETGVVATFDEWTRRRETDHAIEVFDRTGTLIGRFSSADVFDLSGENYETASNAAAFGSWLAGEPEWTMDGRAIVFRVGEAEMILDVDARHVALSRRD